MLNVGDRVRMIREARGEKQPEFAAAMNGAAKALGVDERYDNTKVSKMEIGGRAVSLDDVRVIASLDPEKRGLLWLAWGDAVAHQSVDVPRGAMGKTSLPQYPMKPVSGATPSRRKRPGQGK